MSCTVLSDPYRSSDFVNISKPCLLWCQRFLLHVFRGLYMTVMFCDRHLSCQHLFTTPFFEVCMVVMINYVLWGICSVNAFLLYYLYVSVVCTISMAVMMGICPINTFLLTISLYFEISGLHIMYHGHLSCQRLCTIYHHLPNNNHWVHSDITYA